MIGPEVYVKLNVINLSEVTQILPRKGPAMVLYSDDPGQPPQPMEGQSEIVLFNDIEKFCQTKWFKGIVVGYQKDTGQYNPTDKCLIKLDNTDQLVYVLVDRVFENVDLDLPPENKINNNTEDANDGPDN